MSAYNDFMVKAAIGFVEYSNHYCNLLQLGMDDCCLRNKINLLAMYIDSIPRLFSGSCVEDADVTTISHHINTLIGYPNWATIDGTDITNYTSLSGAPTTTTATKKSSAWNTTIGTAATVISFDESLGTTGSSWGMSYIIYNSLGQEVGYTISNRTKDGFTIVTTENNVHFEGTATEIV